MLADPQVTGSDLGVGCHLTVSAVRVRNGSTAQRTTPDSAPSYRSSEQREASYSPDRARRNSSGAAVFVDEAIQHVNSLHRRLDRARLDQPQP